MVRRLLLFAGTLRSINMFTFGHRSHQGHFTKGAELETKNNYESHSLSPSISDRSGKRIVSSVASADGAAVFS